MNQAYSNVTENIQSSCKIEFTHVRVQLVSRQVLRSFSVEIEDLFELKSTSVDGKTRKNCFDPDVVIFGQKRNRYRYSFEVKI